MERGADHASVFTYSSLKSHLEGAWGVSFCLPGKPGEGCYQRLPPPSLPPGHFGGAGARLGGVKSFLAENAAGPCRVPVSHFSWSGKHLSPLSLISATAG